MKVFVTGAAGKLGSSVVSALLEASHDVVAVDQRFSPGLPVRLEVMNLLDPLVSYRLLEGCDAVVHLAANTHQFARPLAQQVLTENLTMTANVFRAALEVGLKRFVFASSIQVMLGGDERVGDKERRIPCLPMDGTAPSNPRNNAYALSKDFGERMLAAMCVDRSDLTCTALRYPGLVNERWLIHWKRRMRFRAGLPVDEGFTHLMMPDAAAVALAALEREKPGYHVYFPANVLSIEGYSVARMVEEFFVGVPRSIPADQMTSLVDLSALEQNLGWSPKLEPVSIKLED
jgi:nucleoside-diphosphate-sugar epimerase